mmetsp:Transcript_10277/g.15542  ORF Transcript_10277/g.15542 Transcript_10277/m.15542 type:complete len:82 (-) Transcript_10277:253-498(-)
MPKHKRKKTMPVLKEKKEQRYCVSCNAKINQHVWDSQKMGKQCHRCYRDNTNKGLQRKQSKQQSQQRGKRQQLKYDKNFNF